MPKKKKKPIFKVIILTLIGIYLAVYLAFEGGYYNYKEYNKMNITKEAMAQFEKDIAEGKDITIEEYITETKDYRNKVSDLGVKSGEFTEKVIVDGLGSIFKIIGKLVTN